MMPKPRRNLCRILLPALALLGPIACGSARQTPPPAQESSATTPSSLVHVKSGTSFNAACLIVNVGDTVEWRNLSPRASVIVLSVATPYELSSPALLSPYNFVAPESSDECTQRVDGACVEPIPFSFWRHTFSTPGIFGYQDQGGSATTSTGTYGYGLPAGTTATSKGVGTICVRGEGQPCTQVCCSGTGLGECAAGVTCVANRCGGVVQ